MQSASISFDCLKQFYSQSSTYLHLSRLLLFMLLSWVTIKQTFSIYLFFVVYVIILVDCFDIQKKWSTKKAGRLYIYLCVTALCASIAAHFHDYVVQVSTTENKFIECLCCSKGMEKVWQRKYELGTFPINNYIMVLLPEVL